MRILKAGKIFGKKPLRKSSYMLLVITRNKLTRKYEVRKYKTRNLSVKII